MKNPLLLALSLVAIATSLSAQTARLEIIRGGDSCYLFPINPIPTDEYIHIWEYTTLSLIARVVEPNAHGEADMSAKYPAGEGIAVYGVAVASQSPLLENMYLDLTTYDPLTNFNRIGTIDHNKPYISAKYAYDLSTHGPLGNEISTCEYYFDRPIHLSDSFYVGIRVVTVQPPYDDYKSFPFKTLTHHHTYYNITNGDTAIPTPYTSVGHFFPIVKLPCPRLDKPHLGASVGGMALFTWDTADGATYQIGLSRGDDSSYSFVHLSDTLRGGQYTYTGSLPEGWYNAHLRQSCTYCFSGADTLAWSRWSEGRRFYYTPDPAAIAPSDPQPPTFDLYPTPTTGLLNVEFRNVNLEGAATLQLLDPEGRLLQEFKIQNSKFQIDISSLPAGTYLLRAAGATRRVVKK